MAINRNTILATGVGAAALVTAFSFGLFSSDDAGVPVGVSDADSPVVTVYKSPT